MSTLDEVEPAVAGLLLVPGVETSPFLPPTIAVDHVVKLIVTTARGDEEGTGFFVAGAKLRYILFTARHVVRPGGRQPTSIRVETSGGCSFLAVAYAHPAEEGDELDCAVVLCWRSLRFTGPRFEAPPSSRFSARLRGYRVGSRTPGAVEIPQADAGGWIISHFNLGATEGMSGGPLVAGGRVVGSHIRAETGLALFRDTGRLQACIDAADRVLREPNDGGIS